MRPQTFHGGRRSPRHAASFLASFAALLLATAAGAQDASWDLRGAPSLAAGDYIAVQPRQMTPESLAMRPGKPAEEMALRGTLETVLPQDPAIRAAALEAEAANQEIWRELLRFTPVITGSIDTTKRTGSFGDVLGSSDDSSSYASISASLPLFSGGSRYYGIKEARSRRDAAVYDARSVVDQRTLRFIEAWTRAVLDQRERTLALSALSRLQQLRRSAVGRKESGFASVSDVALVDADIAATRRAVSLIDGQIARSRAVVARSGGVPPAQSEDLPELGHYLKGGKEALLASAHRTNPELQAAASRYRAEVYSARSAYGRHLPSVSVNGEYRHYWDRPSSRSSTDRSDFTVGLQVKIPLVDLSTVADSVARTTRKDAALYKEAAVLEAVEVEIAQLWDNWQSLKASHLEGQREVKARRAHAKAARARFDEGFSSLDTAIRAETDLLTTQRAVLQIEVQKLLAEAQLLIVSGQFRTGMLQTRG